MNGFHKNWKDLTSEIQENLIPEILKDISSVAEQILKDRIKKDIYGVYQPKEGAWVLGSTYRRREELIPLVVSEVRDKNTLFVTSLAEASESILKNSIFSENHNGAFLELLEKGDLGFWRKNFPRPAISNTEREYEKGNKIKAELNKSIKTRIG